MNETILTRRNLLGTAVAGIVAAAAGTAEAQERQRRREGGARSQGDPFERRERIVPSFGNAQFYKDGKFDENAAKDAVIALCRYHRYPVFPDFKEKLWVSDYGIGKFTEVGLAAIMVANNRREGSSYMLQELFLLPNQMLPEHWHVKGGADKDGPQKDEGWFVRYGRSYVIGEGEPNLPPEIAVPASHGDVTVKHAVVADPGTFVPLGPLGSHHWQFAGKEGVILSEVANYHSNACVRHQNKTANDTFLKGI
ncbi:MAG: hypothetical protein LBN39_12960 [Planctomycetaceae bacterium]|jgi:hypothetical protein|nr:hypothetical protein [Planctomycetaceae bacterium]